MSLLVVGSVALDTVEAPQGTVHDALGGSATFFSYAASYFTPVQLIAIVGDDFPPAHRELLEKRGVDTSGLVAKKDGKTFRWRGKYHEDMNTRDTLELHLNVFTEFEPKLSAAHAATPYIFLANIAPSIQLEVLRQSKGKKFAVADTMDFWIESARDDLYQLLKEVDGLVLNDDEARKLTDEKNLIRAGYKVLDLGPRFVIIKKGEHGAIWMSATDSFVLPAYPLGDVVDPTGAGDSFAGAFMGYLASADRTDLDAMKRAMAYATVVASFNVEDFSLRRFQRTELSEIESRLQKYRSMLSL